MAFSEADIERIIIDFSTAYMSADSPVQAVGCAAIRSFVDAGAKIELNRNESIDDSCLGVVLERALGGKDCLPDIYQGLRVFYTITPSPVAPQKTNE